MFHLFCKKIIKIVKEFYIKCAETKLTLNFINLLITFFSIFFVMILFIDITTNYFYYHPIYLTLINFKNKILISFHLFIYTNIILFFRLLTLIIKVIITFLLTLNKFFSFLNDIIVITFCLDIFKFFEVLEEIIVIFTLSFKVIIDSILLSIFLFMYVLKNIIENIFNILPYSVFLTLKSIKHYYSLNAVHYYHFGIIFLNIYQTLDLLIYVNIMNFNKVISFFSPGIICLFVSYLNIFNNFLNSIFLFDYTILCLLNKLLIFCDSSKVNYNFMTLFFLNFNVLLHLDIVYDYVISHLKNIFSLPQQAIYLCFDSFIVEMVYFEFNVHCYFLDIYRKFISAFHYCMTQLLNWLPWVSIIKDTIFIHISIIYVLFLIIVVTNTYYLLFYLFNFLVLIGLLIGILQLELFIGFLWLIESSIILISILILFFLNIKGYLKFKFKIDLLILIFFKLILFYFIIFFYSDDFKISVKNIFNILFVWENYYEALSNKNLNDFSGLFNYLFSLFSFEFIIICLILFFGSLVCIHVYKKKKNKKLYNNTNSILLLKNFFNFNFFRKQDLKNQAFKKSSSFKINKKRWYNK